MGSLSKSINFNGNGFGSRGSTYSGDHGSGDHGGPEIPEQRIWDPVRHSLGGQRMEKDHEGLVLGGFDVEATGLGTFMHRD